MPKRDQTPQEIAEVVDVDEKTVRRWCSEGCPHTRRGRVLRLNDGEVQAWMKKENLSGKPGRPKAEAADPEFNKDYWLARKYRHQCLREEGELVDSRVVIADQANRAQTAKNRLMGIPSQIAPQLYGQDVPSIERLLSESIEHAIADLHRGR